MEPQQDSPVDLEHPVLDLVHRPQPQQALVAIQALERHRLLQDTEERKHLHNQTSQKSKETTK